MSEKIVQLNEEAIKSQIKELVRGSGEETLDELLEAEKLIQAARYERNEQRQATAAATKPQPHCHFRGRCPQGTQLKGISFETAIIARYHRRESSVEETLIEMCLVGVSVRCVVAQFSRERLIRHRCGYRYP